jgi:hypothetical protein
MENNVTAKKIAQKMSEAEKEAAEEGLSVRKVDAGIGTNESTLYCGVKMEAM